MCVFICRHGRFSITWHEDNLTIIQNYFLLCTNKCLYIERKFVHFILYLCCITKMNCNLFGDGCGCEIQGAVA